MATGIRFCWLNTNARSPMSSDQTLVIFRMIWQPPGTFVRRTCYPQTAMSKASVGKTSTLAFLHRTTNYGGLAAERFGDAATMCAHYWLTSA
jgi:hypothetical protein